MAWATQEGDGAAERGAGPTLASGSSACAVAAAAVRTGRIEPGVVTVEMPGGALTVTVRDDYRLRLRGPVAPVGRFEADPDWTLTGKRSDDDAGDLTS